MGYKHNKDDIIQSGTELLRKHGYESTGINDILKACGIPRGSFYNFFYTKEEFALEALDHFGRESLARIKKLLSKSGNPLERLESLYDHLIESNVTDGLDAGCLVNNMSIEMAGKNRRIAIKSGEIFELLIKEIALSIAEGQDQGLIVKDHSAKELASYMHTGMYGAFSQMKIYKNRSCLEQWKKITFSFISTGNK